MSNLQESKNISLEHIAHEITTNGFYICAVNPESQSIRYEFTANGFNILHFFLNIIEAKPNITLQELRSSFNHSKNIIDFSEAACVDYLVHKFTGKFGVGGGFWCRGHEYPTEEKQLLKTYDVVRGIGCTWDEQTHLAQGYLKVRVGNYAVNIGIFTFNCRSSLLG